MVTKYKLAHARQCMMGGCRNKNSDLYSKRVSKYDGGLYLCPDCAREIGLLNPDTVPEAEEAVETVKSRRKTSK